MSAPLAPATVVDAYDQWHSRFDSPEDPIDAPWHQLAIPQLPDLQGSRVLEIGCGRGGFSAYLAGRGADLVAADFSPTAVRMAAHRLEPHPNAEAVVADIEAIPFDRGTFDVVISLDTLEHVPHPTLAVAELVRVLRPGGKLILTTNNYVSLIGLWRLVMRLAGKRFTEFGQPINQPLKFFPSTRLMRGLGCDVELVDGAGHYLRMPRTEHGYLRLGFLERPHRLTKWFGIDRMVVATKR
jgi:SAM-dependent methyltransferase